MSQLGKLVLVVGFAVSASAVAADQPKGDYSALRPSLESSIEQPPEALGRGVLVDLTAKVKDIDMKKRLVTLEGPLGREVTVEVSPAAHNLRKVKVGDDVRIKYYEGAAVELLPPGDVVKRGTEERGGIVRAAPGETPGGIAARQVTRTVKILSVDPYKKTIAFRGEDGRYREVSMKQPHLQHYLSELQDGDTVQVVYTEALAVSLEPAQK
jgi:hypothetical protein